MSNETQKGLLFAGDLFVSIELADGSFGNFKQYECDKLEISTPSEFKEKLSKGRTTYGQPFVSVPVPKPAEFGITFSEVTREIFAMQLSGLLVPIDVAASAMAAVEITAALDEWVQLPVENIAAAGFSVTNSAGDVTYVEDVDNDGSGDYQVNRRLGLMRALSDGDIADAATVKVTGNGQAITGTRIVGARRYKTTMHIRLDGINLADNRDVLLEAKRAVVASDAAYDFLQSEVSEAPLKGKMEIPGPGQAPFDLDYRNPN